jgi:hypothetical protein
VMSNISVNTITDASGGSTASINGLTPQASNMQPFNRIINGAMTIDQRNAGAAVTANASYPVDRWSISNTANGTFSAQQVSDTPVGFSSSLEITITAAQTANTGNLAPVQVIEGNNIADLGWGAAGAKTVTLSFWVRSSLTGTFGGSLRNSGSSRSYPFTYTISVADTWEYKTITIAGDTSGTWLTTNGIGISVRFSLYAVASSLQAAGAWYNGNATGATGQTQLASTNGATFYITGVQLEAGSTASSFDYRPYGTELALCQRYTEVIKQQSSAAETLIGNGFVYTSPTVFLDYSFKVPKRAQPSLTTSGTVGQLQVLNTSGSWREASVIGAQTNPDVARINITLTSFTGFTTGQACEARIESGLTLILSAEL